MKVLLIALVAVLTACDMTPTVEITEAEPIATRTIVQVGMCTAQQAQWDRTVPSRCAVRLDDGTAQVVKGPVIEGMKLITCPERTNNIDNQRCVYWAGARPRVPAK